MGSQAGRFLVLVLALSALAMLFYMSEYRLVQMPSGPTAGILDNRDYQTRGPSEGNRNPDATNHTFHVQSYNFINETLELMGSYMETGHSSENDYIHINNSGNFEKLVLKLDGVLGLKNKFKTTPSFGQTSTLPEVSVEYDMKSRRTISSCDCTSVFRDDQNEISSAKVQKRPRAEILRPVDYIQKAKNCSNFIHERGYIMNSLTQVEEKFPIAFSILMYKAVEQSERLLRAIYRPQNIYCIHVDNKTDQNTFDAMEAVAGCFENVFVLSTRFDVVWGTMTVLEPDLRCMSELFTRSKSWKYFINLTGQEFPLKTNYELVQILTAYNGANDIDGTRKRANVGRWQQAGPPPHGIVPSKGSLHITASRGYVDFVLHDNRAQDFLNWCREVQIPDEVFFTSLQHNPHLGVPGSYKGIPETYSSDSTVEKPFVTRFKNWGDGVFNWPCHGKRQRLICVFGVGDLPLLATRKELFANKFMDDFEPMALDCMEELHFNHTRDIYQGVLEFDPSWYGSLGFVKNKID